MCIPLVTCSLTFLLQDESSADSLHPEDLQKNGDSNSVIKDRLCQAVRHTAKQFFDPVRKFNGQPVPFQQPKIFTGGIMRWYQVEGMEWLRVWMQLNLITISADWKQAWRGREIRIS